MLPLVHWRVEVVRSHGFFHMAWFQNPLRCTVKSTKKFQPPLIVAALFVFPSAIVSKGWASQSSLLHWGSRQLLGPSWFVTGSKITPRPTIGCLQYELWHCALSFCVCPAPSRVKGNYTGLFGSLWSVLSPIQLDFWRPCANVSAIDLFSSTRQDFQSPNRTLIKLLK